MQTNFKIKILFSGLILAILFLTAPSADAQSKREKVSSFKTNKDRKPHTSNGIHVMPMDPNMDTESLEKDGYIAHPYDRAPEYREPSETPDPEKRDEIFEKAGLRPLLTGWDHFQKDMLYMSAWKFPLSRLQTKYPKIPGTKLQNLQNLIRSGDQR